MTHWKSYLSFVVAIVVFIGVPAPVSAEWDPASFVQLLEEAETAFVAEQYDDALAKYESLEVLLSTSIDGNEIPEEQLESAKTALSTIKYQIALSQLRVGNCPKAIDKFATLLDAENVESAVRVKLDVRLAESHLCAATESTAAGRDRVESINRAWARMSAMSDQRIQLLGDEAESLRAEVHTDLEKLANSVVPAEGEANCDLVDATNKLYDTSFVAGATPPVGFATAAKECSEKPPPVVETGGSSWVGDYGPYILMGVGGAFLVGFLVNEALVSGDVDDFEGARDDCTAGVASACPRALDLADEVDSGATVSLVLLSLGVLAGTGGAAWWWFTREPSGGDETPATGEANELGSTWPRISLTGGPNAGMFLLEGNW